jgi:hypothetical protein
MRKLVHPLTLSAFVLVAAPAAAEEAYTTRIEPRPYYGATVTIEEGVRVFRPLPPHKHVIINPNGRAPVSLNFNESRGKVYNYNYGAEPSGFNGDGGNGYRGGFGGNAYSPGGFGYDYASGVKKRGDQPKFGPLVAPKH